MVAMRRAESGNQRGNMSRGLSPGMRGLREPGRIFDMGLRPLAIDSSIWGDAAHTGEVDDGGRSQDACRFRIKPACRLGDWKVP